MYELQPFDPTFDPSIHNNYAKRREKYLIRDKEKRIIEGVLRDKVEQDYRSTFEVPFTWKRLFMEIFLIGNQRTF